LAAIRHQIYQNIEVIIVDSSKDNTRKIAEKYGCLILSKEALMTQARNIGAIHAKGEYVFHLDADIKIDNPNTITDCVSLCKEGADAVFVPQVFEGEGFWGKCRELEFRLYKEYRLLRVARFVRKGVLDAIGGYDEGLISGEDWDVTQKLELHHYNIAISNTTMIHGWGPISVPSLVRKSYKYGKSVSHYAKKYPFTTFQQWGPSRFLFLLKNGLHYYPKYVIGILLLKSFEFGAGFLGIVAVRFGSNRFN
jgi:glycosyltransferase involved in cell wall biosynthesis